jgi:hypothetical protein
MKISHASCLICLCFMLFAGDAFCQGSESQGPEIGFGVFLSVGGESAHTPHYGSGTAIPLAGVYAEWVKHRVRPGLDLRIEGGTNGVHGPLVGPTISVTTAQGYMRPYAEVLFGPNSANLDTPGGVIIEPGQPVPDTNRDGVTAQGVVGLDFAVSRFCSWRLEFTQSRFSGIPDSHPHAITTGIVIHFR